MIDKNVNVYYGRHINKTKDIQYFARRILKRPDCSCRYSNSSVVKAAAAVTSCMSQTPFSKHTWVHKTGCTVRNLLGQRGRATLRRHSN